MTPADMQGHGVPEVVTVNKVYRTCPVVAMEKSAYQMDFEGPKVLKVNWYHTHTDRKVGAFGLQIGYF